jgi:DNA-binding HxlR family transcriptional regulator
MKHEFNVLDEQKAALRILHTLLYSYEPVSKKELEKTLKSQAVGRSMLYSSHRALKEIGLLKEERVRENNINYVKSSLTEKGMAVAKLVSTLYDQLK